MRESESIGGIQSINNDQEKAMNIKVKFKGSLSWAPDMSSTKLQTRRNH